MTADPIRLNRIALLLVVTTICAFTLFSNSAEAQPRGKTCSSLFSRTSEPEGIDVIRQSRGGIAITQSGLAHLLLAKDPFWIRLLDRTKLTKIPMLGQLVTRVRTKFRTVSFDEIPDYNGVVASGLTSLSFDLNVHLAFQKSRPEYEQILREQDKVSRAKYGDVKLMDVFLTPNRQADTPALLGQLQNGQPVMVVLMSPRFFAGQLEIPTVRINHESLIQNALYASQLEVGGRFYGIQMLNDYVAGLIVELPRAGTPLDFGGRSNFGVEGFKQIVGIVDTVMSHGADVPGVGFDLRPYIATNGNVQLYPTVLAQKMTFREGNASFRQSGQVMTLVRYLRYLTTPQLNLIYEWLAVNRRPIYQALLNHSESALAHEKDLEHKGLPRNETDWEWARAIQSFQTANLHRVQ